MAMSSRRSSAQMTPFPRAVKAASPLGHLTAIYSALHTVLGMKSLLVSISLLKSIDEADFSDGASFSKLLTMIETFKCEDKLVREGCLYLIELKQLITNFAKLKPELPASLPFPALNLEKEFYSDFQQLKEILNDYQSLYQHEMAYTKRSTPSPDLTITSSEESILISHEANQRAELPNLITYPDYESLDNTIHFNAYPDEDEALAKVLEPLWLSFYESICDHYDLLKANNHKGDHPLLRCIEKTIENPDDCEIDKLRTLQHICSHYQAPSFSFRFFCCCRPSNQPTEEMLNFYSLLSELKEKTLLDPGKLILITQRLTAGGQDYCLNG